ncbi:hypothetical protein M885DRAFT_80572 [Pelagophyceae sp. CCMP2097]|nr:hypothetical protein M885DRAFT_80572 [Pelagophyceae sp. CCMP2097]
MHECTDPPIESKKKLHFERGVTSRQSEYDGVGREQRKKAGRWKHNTDAHDAAYAHGAPFESMRLKCGLPSQGGHFHVPRAIFPVPSALKDKVFSKSLGPLKEAIASSEFPAKDVDRTLKGFLKLADHSAEVLIQDPQAAAEREQAPRRDPRALSRVAVSERQRGASAPLS